MPTARTVLVAGPARVVRDSKSTYTLDDVNIALLHSITPISNSAYGTLDHVSSDQIVQATFTPSGEWVTSADGKGDSRGLLWPHTSVTPGTSLLTTSDVPTVFHGADGTSHSIIASAVTQMPSLQLTADGIITGPCTITGMRGTGKSYLEADGLYDEAAGASTFVNTNFATDDIKVGSWKGRWGATTQIPGFDIDTDFQTVDGWTVDFDLTTTPIVVDELGSVDIRYVDLVVRARCRPLGPTVEQMMQAANIAGSVAGKLNRGNSIAKDVAAVGGTAPDLSIICNNTDASTIVLKNAAVSNVGFNFGVGNLRYGEMEWTARRTLSSGALSDLFTFS